MKPGAGITLREIAERLEGELAGGHGDIVISGVASLRDAVPGHISFLAHRRYLKDLQETRASAVVLPKGVSFDRLPSIRVDDPYFAFAQLLHLFYDLPYQARGIDERAIVGSRVHIGRDVTIYPYVYIEEGASIGDQVMIYPGTFVGQGSLIGEHSVIYPNVTIGEDCLFAAQAGIAGSTQIGSHVTMAGQAGVTGHIRIEDHVTVAGQAGVTKDVKEGQTVSGMPAFQHRDWLKAMAVFEDLPELKKKISEISNRIEEIERIIGDKKGGGGYGHKRDSKDSST